MNVLVDTSIWLNHLRSPDRRLISLLEEDQLVVHEDVVGELVSGQISGRGAFMAALSRAPMAKRLPFREVMDFIEREKIYGKGLGWIDCNLLASALVADLAIYTADKALGRIAGKFDCSFSR